jgi:uncharacterized protein YkwD
MFTKRVWVAIVFLAVVLCGSVSANAQGTRSYDNLSDEILKYINEYRAEKGLGPLKNDPTVCKGAEVHSRDMATHRVPFGHDGFDERMAKITSLVSPANGWAENVAYGPLNAKEVVDMWLNSPGHKKNIEGNYNTCGIGIVRSNDGALYFTHIFVNKKK